MILISYTIAFQTRYTSMDSTRQDVKKGSFRKRQRNKLFLLIVSDVHFVAPPFNDPVNLQNSLPHIHHASSFRLGTLRMKNIFGFCRSANFSENSNSMGWTTRKPCFSYTALPLTVDSTTIYIHPYQLYHTICPLPGKQNLPQTPIHPQGPVPIGRA